MRLIDAEEMIAKYGDWYTEEGSESGYIGTMIGVINMMPTVDAVPVVHSHWKEDPSGYGFWICSACGFVSEASAANMLYKFCPVCGAVMDGKGNCNETD